MPPAFTDDSVPAPLLPALHRMEFAAPGPPRRPHCPTAPRPGW